MKKIYKYNFYSEIHKILLSTSPNSEEVINYYSNRDCDKENWESPFAILHPYVKDFYYENMCIYSLITEYSDFDFFNNSYLLIK